MLGQLVEVRNEPGSDFLSLALFFPDDTHIIQPLFMWTTDCNTVNVIQKGLKMCTIVFPLFNDITSPLSVRQLAFAFRQGGIYMLCKLFLFDHDLILRQRRKLAFHLGRFLLLLFQHFPRLWTGTSSLKSTFYLISMPSSPIHIR